MNAVSLSRRSVGAFLVAALALLAALVTAPGPVHAATPVVDQVVAVVNDGVITESELEQEMARARQDLRSRDATRVPDDAVLRRQVLDRLITDHILLQRAEALKITASDAQVNAALANVAKQNKLTPAELQQAITAQGLDFAYYRETLRRQIIIRRLVEREVGNRVTVTDQEIESRLAQQAAAPAAKVEYELSHILIKISAGAGGAEAARKKGEQVLAQIRDGMPFAQAAMRYSQAPDATAGGAIGWRGAGQLPALFVSELKSMRPGQVSPLLQSSAGLHIIRLDDERGAAGVSNQPLVQTHVQHILLLVGEVRDKATAISLLKELRQRIEAGADFSQIARRYSEDLSSRDKGGDLGWLNPGEAGPELDPVINALAVGEISQPVESPYGVHLLKVMGRRTVDGADQLARNRIRQEIFARKSDELYQRWLQQLRSEAYIENRLDDNQ